MRALFGWPGGKSRLAKKIVSMIPPHKTYMEVFGGAGWVLFAKPPSVSKVEVFNDLNGDLVQLFRVVKHNPSSFAEQMELCLHSRKIYLDLFNKKNSGDHPVHEAQRAARFFYLVRESFGHVRGRGWAFGKTNPARNWFDPDHLEAVHARLKRVYIECLDFRKLIKIWDSKDTFFYLDPPYLSASGQRFYGSLEFSEKDLKDLAAILGRISGKFLLSQPNDPEVKKLFHDFKISKTASIHYSLNQKRLTPRRRTELLIRKF